MTKKEFYNEIIKANINEEITKYCENEIEKIVSAAKKRIATSNQKKFEQNMPLIKRAIDECLSDKPVTATEIAAHLEISHQRATHLMLTAVREGMVKSEDIKVPKKGKMKGYTVI